jgi:hypothetical protein
MEKIYLRMERELKGEGGEQGRKMMGGVRYWFCRTPLAQCWHIIVLKEKTLRWREALKKEVRNLQAFLKYFR